MIFLLVFWLCKLGGLVESLLLHHGCLWKWLSFPSSFLWVKMWAWVKEARKQVDLFWMFQMLGLPVTEAQESLLACAPNPLMIINREFFLFPFSFLTHSLGPIAVVEWLTKNYGLLTLGQIPHNFIKFLIFLLWTELRPVFLLFLSSFYLLLLTFNFTRFFWLYYLLSNWLSFSTWVVFTSLTMYFSASQKPLGLIFMYYIYSWSSILALLSNEWVNK